MNRRTFWVSLTLADRQPMMAVLESRGNTGLEITDLYGPFTSRTDALDYARRYSRAKSRA